MPKNVQETVILTSKCKNIMEGQVVEGILVYIDETFANCCQNKCIIKTDATSINEFELIEFTGLGI